MEVLFPSIAPRTIRLIRTQMDQLKKKRVVKLMAEKRFKDLERAAKDRAFKEELYAQYGL